MPFHLCYVHLKYIHLHLGTKWELHLSLETWWELGLPMQMWMLLLHLQWRLVIMNIMCHCCLFFSLENYLYSGVNEIISFQKLVGNLDKMTVGNLGRQHHKSLHSYFKSSWERLYLFGVMSYYFVPSTLLNP